MLFSVSTRKMPFYCLLISIISVGKSAVRPAPLKVMSFILKLLLRFLFVLVFNNLTTIYLHVVVCILLFGVFWALWTWSFISFRKGSFGHCLFEYLLLPIFSLFSKDNNYVGSLMFGSFLPPAPFMIYPGYFFTDFSYSLLMVSSCPKWVFNFTEFRISGIIFFSTRISTGFILYITIFWWNSPLFHPFSSSFPPFSWTN